MSVLAQSNPQSTRNALHHSGAWPRLLHETLIRVRPSPVAAFLKRMFGVQRQVIEASEGTFEVDPVSHIGSQLMYRGQYEPELAAALKRYLSPDATFLDVGANEGYFSVIGGKLVGPGGRVIAVEPQTRLLPVIARNLRLNGLTNVTVVDMAVSDAEGSARLHLTPDTITGSTALAQTTRYEVPTVEVRTTTLQGVMDRANIDRAALVKIDIEGFEYEAILGSRQLFTSGRVDAIALELHRSRIRARGLDPDAIVTFVDECGYRRDLDLGSTYYLWTRVAAVAPAA